MRTERPVPAVIRIRVRDPKADLSDFIALSTTMLQARLIHEHPRELRRASRTSDVLELTCTFVDSRAVRAWRSHPGVKRYWRHLAKHVRGAPRVTRCRDVGMDVDDQRTCACERPSWLLLEPPVLVQDGSSFLCGDCGARLADHLLALEKIPMFALERAYRGVYDIWMGSGVLELWAKRQLASPRSQLNRELVRVARRASRSLRVPVFPSIWSPEGIYRCPVCSTARPLAVGWRGLRRCARCRVAFRG